jgi:hypothetical protein
MVEKDCSSDSKKSAYILISMAEQKGYEFFGNPKSSGGLP